MATEDIADHVVQYLCSGIKGVCAATHISNTIVLNAAPQQATPELHFLSRLH